MRSCVAVIAALATLIVSSTIAAADPDDLVARPIVLAQNQVAIDLTVEANLAPGQIALPLSIAPDLWWGVSPRWTLGLIHSARSVDQMEPGSSFCLRTGDAEGLCERLYRGSGLDARWLAYDDGAFSVAPRARFLIRDIDPAKPAITGGALARWHHGRFGITADPYLQIGVDNTQLGNVARLVVPVYFALQPGCRWELAVQTGYQSDLDVIRDGWHIPAALIVTARATRAIDVSLEGAFASPLGPVNDVKQRALFFTIGWRSGT